MVQRSWCDLLSAKKRLLELPKHECVGEKGSSFSPVSACSRVKSTGAESPPPPRSRSGFTCLAKCRRQTHDKNTNNCNVKQAVVDRWALRTGGISQRPLSINTAGLNPAGAHVLPLICHRGGSQMGTACHGCLAELSQRRRPAFGCKIAISTRGSFGLFQSKHIC